MTTGDPRRLLASPGSVGLERRLLRAGLERGPTDAQRDALWAGLAGQLPGLQATSASSPGASGNAAVAGGKVVASGLATKAVLVAISVIAACVAASVAHLALPHHAAAADVPAPSLTIATSSVASPVTAPTSADAPRVSVGAEASPAAFDRAPRAAAPAARRLPAPHAADAEASESKRLLEARAALRTGDCRRALAVTDDVRQRFPGGTLAEERETLAIQALDCLGRDGDAAERRIAFELAFPGSVYVRSGASPR